MGVLKSFIKYPGGKSRMIEPILQRLPESDIFVDMFCGGGSISIAYAQKYPDATICMNDFDPFTYSMWEIIINGTDEQLEKLINFVSQIPTIELFKFNRDQIGTGDIVMKAYLGIFFHKCTFSGMFNGSPIGGMKQKSIWKVGCHYTPKNIIEKMIRARNLFGGRTIVTNKDFREFNLRRGVVYFDPPYVSVGDKLYAIAFTKKDHLDLSDFIKGVSSTWLLSYNDHPFVRELYSECKIESLDHIITMSSFCEEKKCRVKQELLITKN